MHRALNNKGFTLVELIIVMAVIGILGAILLPNFSSITDKARLKSDIQSALVVQSACELYRAETGTDIVKSNTTPEAAVSALYNARYINGITLQTGSTWAYIGSNSDKKIGILLSDNYEYLREGLSATEKAVLAAQGS